jgi:hypothetical protein
MKEDFIVQQMWDANKDFMLSTEVVALRAAKYI